MPLSLRRPVPLSLRRPVPLRVRLPVPVPLLARAVTVTVTVALLAHGGGVPARGARDKRALASASDSRLTP